MHRQRATKYGATSRLVLPLGEYDRKAMLPFAKLQSGGGAN